MGQEWLQEFEDGETRAVCSKCGVPYRYPRELTLENDGFFYCNRCREQTVLTRDRIQAQSRKRREQPPPKRVQAPAYAEDYSLGESYIASLVLKAAPADTIGGSADELAASWCAIYLGAMVIENKRPTTWISAARAKLITCCDYLLTQQAGSPTGGAMSATDMRYGGIVSGAIATPGSYFTVSAATAGSALVAGYNVTGNVLYLDGAERCMQFVRGFQCSDLMSNAGFRSVYPSGGSPYHTGGPTTNIDLSKIAVNTAQFIAGAGSVLQFVQDLAAVKGWTATYGLASSADFTATTVATLTAIQADCVSFMLTGAADAGTGTVIAPVSITTPRNFYKPFDASGGGTGTWNAGVTAGFNTGTYCLAPLYASGQTTSALAYYDWLMSFTSNPFNRAAPGVYQDVLALTNKGTYNPQRAIAFSLDVVAKIDAAGTTNRYLWASAGLMAPLQSIRSPSELATTKVILEGKYQSGRGMLTIFRPFSRTGFSGFSFQPGTGTNPDSSYWASQVGMLYRSAPKSFADQFTNPARSS